MRSLLYLILSAALLGDMSAQPVRPPKLFPQMASSSLAGAPAGHRTKPRSVESHTVTPSVQPLVDRRPDVSGLPHPSDTGVSPAPKAEEAVAIEWISFEEALERQKTEKRKVFLDVYTEWCGWCKRMDQSTFVDPSVIRTLNKHYYAVKFDAEQKKDIEFQGKVYKHISQSNGRGYHELAHQFLNGRLGYPTSVFMDENMKVIQPLPGFLDAEKLEMILTYFGTNSHQSVPWDSYEQHYKKQ